MKKLIILLIVPLLFSCGGSSEKSIVGSWDAFSHPPHEDLSQEDLKTGGNSRAVYIGEVIFYSDGAGFFPSSRHLVHWKGGRGAWKTGGSDQKPYLCVGPSFPKRDACSEIEWMNENIIYIQAIDGYYIELRRKP